MACGIVTFDISCHSVTFIETDLELKAGTCHGAVIIGNRVANSKDVSTLASLKMFTTYELNIQIG